MMEKEASLKSDRWLTAANFVRIKTSASEECGVKFMGSDRTLRTYRMSEKL